MRLHVLLFLLVSTLTLGSCAETELASHVAKTALPAPGKAGNAGNFKVGKPYKVEGKWYTPTETYNHTETGIASWYGSEFQGRKTANGEKFDRHELTAAHRTLQMPSLVRVTNLENGRSLIVRINDRGPFKRGRVIDVSEKAAELLGFKGRGTAKVKLQVLTEESQKMAMAAKRGEDTRGLEVAMNEPHHGRHEPISATPTLTPPDRREPITYQTAAIGGVESQTLSSPSPAIVPGHVNTEGNFMPDHVVKQMPVTNTNIYVQAGSFGQRDNAERLAQTLAQYGEAKVYSAQVSGKQFYRVRVGPISDVSAADGVLSRMASGGHKEAILVVE